MVSPQILPTESVSLLDLLWQLLGVSFRVVPRYLNDWAWPKAAIIKAVADLTI